MRECLSKSDLDLILREAEFAARKLVRNLDLPAVEIEDVRQDLIMDLISRIKGFDPNRGTLGAFASTIFRNRAALITLKFVRSRGAESPLEQPAMAGSRPVGEVTAEADGLSALLGGWRDPVEVIELRLDIERALGGLTEEERKVLAALSQYSVRTIAAVSDKSVSDMYRRIRRARLSLIALGIDAA